MIDPTATPTAVAAAAPTPIAVPTATPAPTATPTPAPTATPVGIRQTSGGSPGFTILDDPNVVTAAAANSFLTDDMLVLGYSSGSSARAYPVAMMWYHHIVNDIVDGSPVLVTY